jgi:2-polyprenyl-6-methoxyphenol hydroxylase-like FAD-dependent oxidoreductase
MFNKKHIATDALVVGAGPVGLCVAASLFQAGVRPTVLDSRWEARHRAGAVLLHPQSLALLRDLGVVHRLLGAGQRIERIAFLDEEGNHHAKLDLSTRQQPYPFALAVPQQVLITALTEGLASRDVHVSWHHRLTSLEGSGQELVAHVDELDRESAGYGVAHMEEIVERSLLFDARAAVGANGENPIVRRFVGGRYQRVGDEGAVVVFELPGTDARPDEARVVVGKHGVSTLIPLPHGAVQWSFQIEGGTYAEKDLTLAGLRNFLGLRARWYDARVDDIDWATVLPYEGQVASARGRDRVWLVGDAAHTAAPILSQPLNMGLAEGHALGASLAAVIRGEASEVDLGRTAEDYTREVRAFLEPMGYSVDATADEWVRKYAGVLARSVPARLAEREGLAAQMGLHPA